MTKAILDKPEYSLDVSLLIALADDSHSQHTRVVSWFSSPDLNFAVCSFTEAGFIRLAMNPAVVPQPWTA